MKKLVAGVIAAIVAVALVVAWKSTTAADDEPAGTELTAVLDDYWTIQTLVPYAYPHWWTDGQTLVRLGEVSGSLTLLSMPGGQRAVQQSKRRKLSGGEQIKPQALSATAGRSGGPFVAVGLREASNDAKEQPIQAWVGLLDGSDDDEVAPQQLPVDVDPTTSSDNIITVDAAIGSSSTTRRSFVVVQVNQRGAAPELVTCEFAPDDGDGACAWQQVPGPQAGGYVTLGATADGVIAISDEERPTIWYATEASLEWKKLGRAPKGFRHANIVDGADAATLIWNSGDDVELQTVSSRGTIKTVVARSKVPGEPSELMSALEFGGRWYLGGAVPPDPQAMTSFDPRSAGMWVVEDGAWKQVADPLFTSQIDQPVEALWIDGRDRLAAVTTSSVLDVTMFWHFTSK